ncbi:MAG: DUF4388 domain-containing protein [Acidobacteriota bacterium]|nr:DUF4388 domain-containing protein [Acidobacteriota bacterium]
MALRGTLGDFSLTDILQLIGLQRKSGVLILQRDDDRTVLGFDDGMIVSAESSSRPAENRVGSLLVSVGKLTEPRLAEALKIQKQTLQRLGHILVDRGWVDRDTIKHQLALQITETVFELFRWKSGEYDFRPDQTLEWDREFVDPVPCEHLMMEGARRMDEWPFIERIIPSREIVLKPTGAAGQILSTSANPQEAQGSIYDDDIDFGLIPSDPLIEQEAGPKVSQRERHVLRWVDGERTVGEIADLTELGTFEACRTLARLVELKLVEQARSVRAEGRGLRLPQLFQATAPARALKAVVLVLGIFGLVCTANQGVRMLWPTVPDLGLPETATPASLLGRSLGFEDAALVADKARVARIERALQVYFLHRGGWPGTLDRLVELELVPEQVIVDPWGQPYRFEGGPFGYRLARGATGSDEPFPPGALRAGGPPGPSESR